MLDISCEVIGCRPGEGQAVKGAGPAADLVHQNQTLGCRIVEDVCGFGHLDHKGRSAAGQIVGSPNTGKDPIDRAYYRRIRRDMAPNVRH